MVEIWKPCPGFPDYHVSDRGRVKSVATERKCIRSDGTSYSTRKAKRILKQKRSTNGYMCVIIYKDGKPATKLIHRLVCWTFHGKHPADRPTVRHVDGNRDNNNAANLAWGSWSEQAADRLKHGTFPVGEKHYKNKYSDELIKYVRARYIPYHPARNGVAIGKELGIHPSYVQAIVRGDKRKHVPS